MRIETYVNLPRTKSLEQVVYSVRNKGRVIDHTSFLAIKDPSFVVGKKGRERVLRERRKNVHAFVRGEWANGVDESLVRTRVSYNPYKEGTFVRLDTGKPIASASYALLTPDGVYAYI